MTVGAKLEKLEVSHVMGIVHQFPAINHLILPTLYSHMGPLAVETTLNRGRHPIDVHAHIFGRKLVSRDCYPGDISILLSCIRM